MLQTCSRIIVEGTIYVQTITIKANKRVDNDKCILKAAVSILFLAAECFAGIVYKEEH